MFKLYSPPQPRPHSAEWELLRLACWSDEESCLALIALGNQCAWGVAPMRRLLAGQDANCAIPTPIRMLAEPYGRNASQLPKHHYLHYLDYAYRNDREAGLLKLRSGKNATFEPLLQKALAADAVYQTEIAMSLSQHPRADVFAAALIDYTCPRLLCDWLQKYSEAELGFSHQDIAKILLLRVRAPGPIIQILTVLEGLQPGFARTAIAEDGCNLLWLATPHAADRDQFMPINLLAPASPQPNLLPLFKFLIGKLGVSPFQQNQRGISFADYDLVARAIGQRFALVGLSNRVPGFHDRRYWGFARSENDNSTHFDSKKSPRP
ncbi:MAG: hypothetical protein GX945_15010, partial [Lentisphaerae bacterium]|nr:hypothetical protein [Lentisphaerota bacterium]